MVGLDFPDYYAAARSFENYFITVLSGLSYTASESWELIWPEAVLLLAVG